MGTSSNIDSLLTQVSVGVFYSSPIGIPLVRTSVDEPWNIPTRVVRPGTSITTTIEQLVDETLGLKTDVLGLLTMEWWSQHPDDHSNSRLWLIYNGYWLTEDDIESLSPYVDLRFVEPENLNDVTTPRLAEVLRSSCSDKIHRSPYVFEDGYQTQPLWARRPEPDYELDH